ncbi:unnamed protein product, partial [Gulo gulo]
LLQREPEGLGGGKGKGRTEKREKKKHAAPEGDSLCFAVACVDRNQMCSCLLQEVKSTVTRRIFKSCLAL